ncbi:hypothetical protein OPQ81_010888 [Rhizoctonia solani]|nr:hypothetical protein OPQ81_010888 [Rhizoctonia solani]
MERPLAVKSSIHSHLAQRNFMSDTSNPLSPLACDPTETRPLRILSLDGGGVRGLSSLVILRELLARVEQTQGVTKPVLPADFFDLIVGTSTGGIIALMLGRLRMTLDEVLDIYLTLSKSVFRTGRISTAIHACATMLTDGVPSMYNEVKLEKYLKETISRRTKDQDAEALLEDLSPNSCRTAVVSARSTDATRPILMRSYAVPHDADPEKFKIWEAARATSAAPLYFRPMQAGVYKVPYLDGCISGHSNPSWLAMQESKYLWPDRKIGLFLSLGTGSPNVVALQAPIRRFILGFVYLAASTVQVHEMAWREFYRKYEVSPYVRLSVDHEISKVRLDDPSSLDNIIAATLAYLEVVRTSEKVQRCVEFATGKKHSKLRACNGWVLFPTPLANLTNLIPTCLKSPHEDEDDTHSPLRG